MAQEDMNVIIPPEMMQEIVRVASETAIEKFQHEAERNRKAVKDKRSMALEPMNSYERHVIHTALQDTPSVTTFSIGTEPNRRVVVSYDRTKA